MSAALALLLQRCEIEASYEIDADFVFRNIEAVADDAAARRAGGGRRRQRGEQPFAKLGGATERRAEYQAWYEEQVCRSAI